MSRRARFPSSNSRTRLILEALEARLTPSVTLGQQAGAQNNTEFHGDAARTGFDSIETVRSTEPMAIVEALENWKFESGNVRYNYRKWDHQMQLRNLVVQVKEKITDKWDYFDVKAALPENPADLDKVFGTPEEVGCKMG